MADYNFKNNLKTTLQAKLWNDATAISCNHVVTSEDEATRLAAWPAFPFTLTVVDTANDNVEVIKCTSLASNLNNVIVFTCERAQETTTAQTFEIATTRVEHRLTAGALNSIARTAPATTTSRGIGRVATSDDLVDGATITNGPAFLSAGDAAIKAWIKSLFGDVGDLVASFATSKDGHLLCNGGLYSRTTYAGLFALIGTAFGAGDGSTTFKVPDFRGRTIQGANANLMAVLSAGLPNATGTFGSVIGVDGDYVTYSGVFGALSAKTSYQGGGGYTAKLDFNLSRASAIYGASTTVQPPAIAANIFIKY